MTDAADSSRRRYLVEDAAGQAVSNGEFVNDLSVADSYNELGWDCPSGGPYRVFCDVGKGFGLIGTTEVRRFIDDGFTPNRRSKPKSLVSA